MSPVEPVKRIGSVDAYERLFSGHAWGCVASVCDICSESRDRVGCAVCGAVVGAREEDTREELGCFSAAGLLTPALMARRSRSNNRNVACCTERLRHNTEPIFPFI